MSEKRGVLVEFVGLPASGKSFLANRVQEELAQSFADERITTSSGTRGRIDRPSSVARLAAGQLARSPVDALRSLRHLVATRQQDLLRSVRFFLYQLYVCAELHHARHNAEIHLSDQGFIQHLWRVQLTARATGKLSHLARTAYPAYSPDLVVFVEVEHRTRMERAVDRGHEIDEQLFDPQHPLIQDDLESYRHIKSFVRELATEPGMEMQLVTIENRADNLEQNVADLADHIGDVLEEREGNDGRPGQPVANPDLSG